MKQNATIRHLAGTLKQDYSGSTYALFASLHLARLDVQEGNYAAAERELRSVLTANPPLEIRLLAELRLARVVAAGGDPQAALAIVTAATPGTYAAAYAEVEGDLQVQLGNEAAAIEAYEARGGSRGCERRRRQRVSAAEIAGTHTGSATQRWGGLIDAASHRTSDCCSHAVSDAGWL